MKTLKIFAIMLSLFCCKKAVAQPAEALQPQPFYNLKAETLRGKPFDFSSLKGKKVLMVNTASKCGFTKQYADLQKLYEEYGGDNFTIIGFPANDFMRQEPGSNEEIETFCQVNFGVTFQMMAKIHVKGDSVSPVYRWLTTKALNSAFDSEVKWNFQKYLIDENGKLVGVAYSREKPNSDRIVGWIKTGKLEEK